MHPVRKLRYKSLILDSHSNLSSISDYITSLTTQWRCTHRCFLFFKREQFLKSVLDLLQYCFCSMFWFLGCETCGILAPQPGTDPAPHALEIDVLTTGPSGKSPQIFFRLVSVFHLNSSLSQLLGSAHPEALPCCVVFLPSFHLSKAGSGGKESACNAGDVDSVRVRKIPWGKE